MFAQGCRIFVDGEARSVSRDLEQYATWLEEVNRLEPKPVDHFGRPPVCARDLLAHRELGAIIRHSPRDVMHATGAPAPTCFVRDFSNLDVPPGSTTGDF